MASRVISGGRNSGLRVSPAGLRLRVVAAVVSFALAASLAGAACTEPSQSDTREAAVYEELLRWVIETERPGDGDGPPSLFVDSATDSEIPLEVQVEVIDRLGDDADVRFIDDREEAVTDDELAPVHDEGVLVGLGAVPTGPPVIVRLEVYRSVEDTAAYLVELAGSDEAWRISGTPQPVIVEDLVPEEE